MKRGASYKRALLKLSGIALGVAEGAGLDRESVAYVTQELAAGHEVCPELAVVIGGGNIVRGARFCPSGAGRVRADYAGMVGTIVNALVLQEGLQQAGLPAVVYSTLPIEQVARPFDAQACAAELSHGHIVILAGGTGRPMFTTDTAAALLGVQLAVDIVLKATRVDGVYSADPEKDPGAKLFARLSYQKVLEGGLGVMDACAISLCREHGLPVRVLNYRVEGNIRRALSGEPVGTLIGNPDDGH